MTWRSGFVPAKPSRLRSSSLTVYAARIWTPASPVLLSGFHIFVATRGHTLRVNSQIGGPTLSVA